MFSMQSRKRKKNTSKWRKCPVRHLWHLSPIVICQIYFDALGKKKEKKKKKKKEKERKKEKKHYIISTMNLLLVHVNEKVLLCNLY